MRSQFTHRIHASTGPRLHVERMLASPAPPYIVPAVDLPPLAAHFVDVADAYERGRPEYTPAVAEAIAAELQIAPSARVLDLAAGEPASSLARCSVWSSMS